MKQLANMTASAAEARDGNLTSASLAAVAMATTAVDAALLNVEQAVGKAGQNKQVWSGRGEGCFNVCQARLRQR